MSKDFDKLVDLITDVRVNKQITAGQLRREKDGLKLNEYKLAFAQQNNQATRPFKIAIDGHLDNIQILERTLQDYVLQENTHMRDLLNQFGDNETLIPNLNDRIPVLFFPVRIETSFQLLGNGNHELWVRIFPDDIAVDTHEEALTENEIEEGKKYWEAFVIAGSDVEKIQAWDILCRSFSHERAAWIILQMTPTNMTPGNLQFPSPPVKADAWSKQPEVKILPDMFTVVTYDTQGNTASFQGANIPDNLKIGIDPNPVSNAASEFTFDRDGNGDLIVNDPEVAWMIDFNAAIANGLGLKIPISLAQYNQGFRRILVLGVKASLTPASSQERLEELLNNHHYTDGFSLLKQGTNTNNSDTDYSGYSMVDFGNKTTHATERDLALFTPVTTQINKSDGQVFCEALGIEFDPLYHIYHSDGHDIRDAMYMSNVLYPATWGYYTNNMLYPLVSYDRSRELRAFFNDYVRSRGALPSIRSGEQPYGLLPATVHSRMNWNNDPTAGVNRNIWEIVQQLHPVWESAVELMASNNAAARQSNSGNTSALGQQLMDIFTHNPVSTEYIHRVGLGPGYIWNNLAYAEGSGFRGMKDQWLHNQEDAIDKILTVAGFPRTTPPRVLQNNYLDTHSSVTLPLVAGDHYPENNRLPDLKGNNLNYLGMLSQATYYSIRDEDYHAELGIEPGYLEPSLLYYMGRQSMLLEYYNIACDLLELNDDQRIEPEFINLDVKGKQNEFKVIAGSARWSLLEQPFAGFDTIARFIDSGALSGRGVIANLETMRVSFAELAQRPVRELNLLTREVLDTTSFRLDAWRLALVNQRINAIREIQDGSSSRKKGIYLGAYGWVEEVKRKTKTVSTAPTGNFAGTIYKDSRNEGFIHAPSINQAITGAVLRSGYVNRAQSGNESPLSVNLSSERVRSALEILEGIRNGQELGVLLGYEFERRLHSLYAPPAYTTDQYIEPLRRVFSLNNTILSNTPETIDKVKARNVVNGVKLVKQYQSGGISSVISLAFPPSSTPPAPTGNNLAAIQKEIDWMCNLTDAVGDVTVSEGMFQLVQGNPVKAGAITDAASKGGLITEPDVLDTPKTGTQVYQRFTLHFSQNIKLSGTWLNITASVRSKAEPYLNKWIGDLIGDPAQIKGKVINTGTNTESDFSLASLDIQPLDLLYLCGDQLQDDDSMLSLLVKRTFRIANPSILKKTILKIDYAHAATGTYTFADILPIIRYARKLITTCRALDTLDYVVPEQAESVQRGYDLVHFFNRVNTLRKAYNTHAANLATVYNSGNTTNIAGLNAGLFKLSAYGLEQTIYEYNGTTAEDLAQLKDLAKSVVEITAKKRAEFNAITFVSPVANPPAPEEMKAYIQKGMAIVKIILGNAFSILPRFRIAAAESVILSNTLAGINGYGTLLNDHDNDGIVLDEWVSSIAKVKKNAANYELLTALSAIVNLDSFTTSRELQPFQLPYDNVSTQERWLGASVMDPESVRDGRVSFGISLPAPIPLYDFTDWQTGIMIEEWIDIIPISQVTSGVAFHHDQPNAKPPQCLILGLTPQLTGQWQWQDLVDMLNETLDLAKQRAVDYETISNISPIAQLATAATLPFTTLNSTIGLTPAQLSIL